MQVDLIIKNFLKFYILPHPELSKMPVPTLCIPLATLVGCKRRGETGPRGKAVGEFID